MADLPARKDSVGSMSIPDRAIRSAWIARWTVAPVVVLGLMLLCQGLNWDDPPRGQPAQMKSRVKYDAKLSDPFFGKEDWISPGWLKKAPDGRIKNRLGGPDEKKLR